MASPKRKTHIYRQFQFDFDELQRPVEQNVEHRAFADAGPLGLSAFAATILLISLINLHADNVVNPNIVIGMSLAYGGGGLFVAGMWDFAGGNTFRGVCFLSYSGLPISYAIILIPFFNVADAYPTSQEFNTALALFLTCWLIFTVMVTVATIRSNIVTLGLFSSLCLTLGFLVVGLFRDMDTLFIRIGGGVGVLSAGLAWYNAMARLWNYQNSWITLPLGTLPWTAIVRPKPLPWKRRTNDFHISSVNRGNSLRMKPSIRKFLNL